MHELFESSRITAFSDTDISELADISDVSIDTSLALEDRKLALLKQLRNPHCFRSGGTRVTVSFTNNGVPFGDLLKQCILSKLRHELKNMS